MYAFLSGIYIVHCPVLERLRCPEPKKSWTFKTLILVNIHYSTVIISFTVVSSSVYKTGVNNFTCELLETKNAVEFIYLFSDKLYYN